MIFSGKGMERLLQMVCRTDAYKRAYFFPKEMGGGQFYDLISKQE